jgi:ribosomal protein L14E/L6E/L27E
MSPDRKLHQQFDTVYGNNSIILAKKKKSIMVTVDQSHFSLIEGDWRRSGFPHNRSELKHSRSTPMCDDFTRIHADIAFS